MKKSSVILIAVCTVVFAGLLISAALIYPALSSSFDMSSLFGDSTESTTSEAPDTSWAKDIVLFDKDGNEINLADFTGKPVILNFWATWCGYCIAEMPDFEEAYKEYGDEIQFIIVNTDDGIKKGEEFIASKGYTFPTYYDLESYAAIAYGITSIPRTIAIDKNGNVLYNQPGKLTAASLQDIIDKIK